MNKKSNAIAFVTLIFALSGCGNSVDANLNGSDIVENSSLPTYSDDEHILDLQNLNASEKSLEKVGLRFKTSFEYTNGVSTTTYSWDKVFLNAARPLKPAEMQASLEAYLGLSSAYLSKYAGQFRLKKSDGTVKTMQMFESVRKELETKASVAKQTVESIKKL